MKKFFAVLISVVLVFTCFAVSVSAETTAAKSYKIGIIQYMSHPSLDNCYKGIMKGLNASGLSFKVDYQTGASNSAAADCSTFAQNMVAGKCDMIIAIATPAATAAYAAVKGTDIPLIFCAVSDPVAAELVQSMDKPGGNCTGTSDVLDESAQVKLIKALQPNVSSIGVLYTTSEQNSITQLKNLQDVCAPQNIKVEAIGVQNGSDVPSAASALAAKVDCINNFTDNNVVENLSVLLDAANAAGIPVYGSEEEQVKNGCIGSMSIDYVALGQTTGEMAADVLGGASVATMAVKTTSEATPVLNSTVLSAKKISVPAEFANATMVQSAAGKPNGDKASQQNQAMSPNTTALIVVGGVVVAAVVLLLVYFLVIKKRKQTM